MSLGIAVPLILAVILGSLIGWLAQRSRSSVASTALERRLAEADARLQERERQVRELDTRLQVLATVESDRSRLSAELDMERRSAGEKIALLQQAELRLRESFQSLSAEALRQNNDSFLQLARTSLGELHKVSATELDARQKSISELMSPIRETLEKVEGKLQETELKRVGSYESLMEQVRSMSESQKELGARTKNLVDALRSPTVRGRWGEIQLKRVCEMAGMVDHCDFVEQESITTSDGKLRPDVTVRLPGGKIIIVDAKAPLQAYLDAMEAPDDAIREQKLKDHSRQVRDHITKLSAKSYWGQFEETPEFVVMFLPGETFFSAALQYDPGLIEYGVEQKVIPASPTTLIALLRSVAYGWQQDRIAQNAAEISELGRELYDRVRVFAGHYTDTRKHLQKSVDAFNSSIGSLEKNVLPQARRFKTLGATTAAELPDIGMIQTVIRTLEAPELIVPIDGAVAMLPMGGGSDVVPA
jgi:DNA recombination protein RmuC